MKSAVVLAAGLGNRAWPYSGVRQKCTLPVCNVPLVRRIVLDLRAAGIETICVVTGHRAAAVRYAVGNIEGVRFAGQATLSGPVDAARIGLNAVDTEDVLVCFGDIATPAENVAALLRSYDEQRPGAALLVAERPRGLTSSYTTVAVNGTGQVQGIWAGGGEEHPRFAGMAMARAETLRCYLERNPGIMLAVGVGDMPPPEGDLAYTFELMRQDGLDVFAQPAAGYFVDVDKPWHILEANYRAARDAVAKLETTTLLEGASIHDGAHIAADVKVFLGRNACIGAGCHVEGPIILGEGAQLRRGAIVEGGTILGAHARCEDYCSVGGPSVIGPHSIISHCAEFRGVAFDNVYLYHYCSVSGLLGTHVDIGAATVCGTWRFDNRTRTHHVDGRKETPECHGNATFIGDYCRTGVNAIFMPGVKVGSYSCVGGGAILYDDVPERAMVLPKQELTQREWGPEKLGW